MSLQVRLIDLVIAFSSALDLVSRTVADHHIKVGYLATRLAERLGVCEGNRGELLLAALLHDVGAMPLKLKLEDLVFEQEMEAHALAGWALIGSCPRLATASELVRFHHTAWVNDEHPNESVRELSSIIHLADRVDVSMRRWQSDSAQVDRVMNVLQKGRGSAFSAMHLDAMRDMLHDPEVLAGIDAPRSYLYGRAGGHLENEELDTQGVISFSNLFSLVIDSRSPFTATHSSGVAETARMLGRWVGLGAEEGQKLFVAGLLHDIGKLGVPLSILEKPGPLDADEMAQMQLHAVRSKALLDSVSGFEDISVWGASHHERMNGSGYPSGVAAGSLPLPSRIVAVADVFTAITEDRPYRRGMSLDVACDVLRQQAHASLLDADLVALLLERISEVDAARRVMQASARKGFDTAYAYCKHHQGE